MPPLLCPRFAEHARLPRSELARSAIWRVPAELNCWNLHKTSLLDQRGREMEPPRSTPGGCLCHSLSAAQRRHLEMVRRCLRKRRRRTGCTEAPATGEDDEQQDILAVAASISNDVIAMLCAKTQRHADAHPSHPCVCRQRGLFGLLPPRRPLVDANASATRSHGRRRRSLVERGLPTAPAM